jgi:hypothetical protein
LTPRAIMMGQQPPCFVPPHRTFKGRRCVRCARYRRGGSTPCDQHIFGVCRSPPDPHRHCRAYFAPNRYHPCENCINARVVCSYDANSTVATQSPNQLAHQQQTHLPPLSDGGAAQQYFYAAPGQYPPPAPHQYPATTVNTSYVAR